MTRKAFEKFGFSAATLITDWGQIAGSEVAGVSAPEQLKWPRLAGGAADAEDGTGRAGATLVLRVDPAHALEIEYRQRQLIERINAYFGYRAVATIRLVQAPLERRDARPAPPPATAVEVPAGADPLTAALARLGAGVRGELARSATRRS